MMTTNSCVIANVKQLWTGGSFRILLPFFRTSWCVGVLNSSIFNSFSQSGWVWNDFGGTSEFRGWGGGFENPNSPPRSAPVLKQPFKDKAASRSYIQLHMAQHTIWLASRASLWKADISRKSTLTLPLRWSKRWTRHAGHADEKF